MLRAEPGPIAPGVPAPSTPYNLSSEPLVSKVFGPGEEQRCMESERQARPVPGSFENPNTGNYFAGSGVGNVNLTDGSMGV